jgi:hypothetical protein
MKDINLIEIIKFIKPKFYNTLTWTIVISGLLLIGTPFWQNVIASLLKKYDVTVSSCTDYGDYKWGLALVFCGLIYNIITNSFMQYAENIIQQDKREEQKLRVKKWRDEIASCNTSLGEFYKTESYLELKERLTPLEKNEISKNNSNIGPTCIIHVGAEVTTSTPSSIIIDCYRQSIHRIEKEWGLI